MVSFNPPGASLPQFPAVQALIFHGNHGIPKLAVGFLWILEEKNGTVPATNLRCNLSFPYSFPISGIAKPHHAFATKGHILRPPSKPPIPKAPAGSVLHLGTFPKSSTELVNHVLLGLNWLCHVPLSFLFSCANTTLSPQSLIV
jgi:hypothetical protein